jgi:hypothetical protein
MRFALSLDRGRVDHADVVKLSHGAGAKDGHGGADRAGQVLRPAVDMRGTLEDLL